MQAVIACLYFFFHKMPVTAGQAEAVWSKKSFQLVYLWIEVLLIFTSNILTTWSLQSKYLIFIICIPLCILFTDPACDIPFYDKCFKIIEQGRRFDQAEKYCEKLNPPGKLASLDDQHIQDRIDQYIDDTYGSDAESYWHKMNIIDHKWQWFSSMYY